jgi:PAS domain S-box-containing protein
MMDNERRIVSFNQAFLDLFGYEKNELEGESIRIIHQSDESFRSFGETVYPVIDQSGYFRTEWEFVRKDAIIIPVETVTSTIKSPDGSTKGFVAVIRDITERKQAEEEKKKLEAQLTQAQRMEAIGTLAGGIAHNFNNLLMGIMGNTSLMLLETDPTHPNYKRLNTIEKMVQSGSKLTTQLLGYAREGRYEVRPISFNQLVKDTSDTFDTTRKEIRVHQDLAEDLPGIIADQGQIEQVLLNLYVNAAEAMPGGGDLFLHTTNITHKDISDKPYKVKPGDYILLIVRDTGIGMDKETKERIFDPFFTTKGLAKGTGLGLASVYGIIKAHGGYIDVYSKKGHARPPRLSPAEREDGGQGTTFYIYLPASEKEAVREKKKLHEEVSRGKETVLLVDDEEMVLDVGVQLLKTLGYTVLEAKGGREAVEIYRENKDKIDIVLLDMVMPDMGGGEAYDRMKEINPDIKVLLSSGYSIDGQATEIMKRGCNDFIQKPFNMKELSKNIREILDKPC